MPGLHERLRAGQPGQTGLYHRQDHALPRLQLRWIARSGWWPAVGGQRINSRLKGLAAHKVRLRGPQSGPGPTQVGLVAARKPPSGANLFARRRPRTAARTPAGPPPASLARAEWPPACAALIDLALHKLDARPRSAFERLIACWRREDRVAGDTARRVERIQRIAPRTDAPLHLIRCAICRAIRLRSVARRRSRVGRSKAPGGRGVTPGAGVALASERRHSPQHPPRCQPSQAAPLAHPLVAASPCRRRRRSAPPGAWRLRMLGSGVRAAVSCAPPSGAPPLRSVDVAGPSPSHHNGLMSSPVISLG